MSTTLEQFCKTMAEAAHRQAAYELEQKAAAENLRRSLGPLRVRGDEGAGNKWREPVSDKLINTVVAITYGIRKALHCYPDSQDFINALQIATGLGMESSETIIKAVPHLRGFIPDYTPDRERLLEQIDSLRELAEAELKLSMSVASTAKEVI